MSVESVTTADIDTALDTIFTGTQWIQLHTGHPGAAGTANIATNSTRKSFTWSAAAAGVKASASDVLWSAVSTTETYLFYSIWSLSSGGVFHGSGAITGGIVVAGQDFDLPIASIAFTSTVAA